MLTRDRLLGTYEVKPTLARLKTTLLGTGGVLLLSSSLLFGLIGSKADGDGMYGEWGSCLASLVSHHLQLACAALRALLPWREQGGERQLRRGGSSTRASSTAPR